MNKSLNRKLLAACALLSLSSLSIAGNVSTKVVDAKGQPLADAVVYLVPQHAVTPVAASAKHAIIDQVDKEFVPRVTVVQTGTAVDFPNNDNIRHQVYSFSPAKTFELKLYSGRPSAPVQFDKAGVAVLGCNIHDHMIAWVLSVDTPYYARTDAQGRASVANLPDGKYQLTVWHPGMKAPLAEGEIDSKGGTTIERALQVETGKLLGAVTDSVASGVHGEHEHHHAGS